MLKSANPIMEKICPKSAVVYITQMVVILGVVTAAVINLSLKQESNKEMWISLLCSTIGYILPNPKLRKPKPPSSLPEETATE